MIDFSNLPVLWQRTPEAVASSLTDHHVAQELIAEAIRAEREAARPYVQSCTDARWADEPGIQERVHAVTLNGVDVTAVCVGFNTTERGDEVLVVAGSNSDGRPKMILKTILNQDQQLQPAPLTVRIVGDVQVQMTGVLNQVYANHEAAR